MTGLGGKDDGVGGKRASDLPKPCIDCGPAVKPKTPDAPPPQFVHPPQRDHRYPKPSPDPHRSRRTQPTRTLMRARGINRRHEQRIRPSALADARFSWSVRRPSPKSLGLGAPMHAIGLERRCACHHHDQRACLRQSSDPPQHHAAFPCGRSVMPKHHTRSGRQPAQRRPQRIADPLVGHQPASRNGRVRLSERHVAAYSARHDI